MMLSDDTKKERKCYGCGQSGHMRGADECRADKDAVWGGAPKAYLEKIQRKFGATPSSGKRTFPSSDAKTPCPYWSSGDGYCKFAERCKFDHSGPQGGSKRAREFGKGGKGKGKGKSKGKGKGRGGGKGKRTSLMVQKKGVRFGNLKDIEGNASMMVGGHGTMSEDEGESAETDLYNLMRGYTSLMITEGSDSSEDEGGEENEEDENEESSEVVPEESKTTDDNQRLFGLSLPDFGSRVFNERGVPLTWTAGSVTTPETTAFKEPTFAPTWGNNPMPDSRDEEWANEWRESGIRSKRKARDQEISTGGSPPPKLREDNLFSEGSSRKSNKPYYKEKEEITDEDWYSGNKQKERDSPPSKERRRMSDCNRTKAYLVDDCYVLRPKQASSCVDLVDSEEEAKFVKDLDEYEESSSDEEEGSSSEKGDRDDSGKEENEREDSDSDDNGTIGQIFREIREGTFNADKRRKIFAGNKYNVRKVTMGSSKKGFKKGLKESEMSSRGYYRMPGFNGRRAFISRPLAVPVSWAPQKL
jgi:hypothetical protein